MWVTPLGISAGRPWLQTGSGSMMHRDSCNHTAAPQIRPPTIHITKPSMPSMISCNRAAALTGRVQRSRRWWHNSTLRKYPSPRRNSGSSAHPATDCLRRKWLHYNGVRVGEATNPGPPNTKPIELLHIECSNITHLQQGSELLKSRQAQYIFGQEHSHLPKR